VGETVARCRLPDVGMVTGFTNHGGATRLGPDVIPLGDVEHGPANEPGGRAEGALGPGAPAADGRIAGVVATYLHGPVLARNPALADHLLARVVGRALPPLDPALLPDLPALRRAYLGPDPSVVGSTS
jgi:CobQ-like glutamine amidotransferase family enzyme